MSSTSAQLNIDYAVQAKTALSAVERLTADLDAVPQKTSMCREKWRDYGAALLAQRLVMPSNQQFGQWVREHGLDAGLAADRIVRSDAMWLAEHHDIVGTAYKGNSHHPTHIRQACRDAGHEWAGETQHQKERKEKSARTKANAKNYSWMRVAKSEGLGVEFGGGNTSKIRAELHEIDADPDLFSVAKETRLREVCALYLARQQPSEAQAAVDEQRSTVNESAKMRFDKAIGKATAILEGAYQAKLDALQSSYQAELQKAVEARVAPEVEAERARAREMFERNQRELQNLVVRRKNAMTKKEYQLLLNCLHPDRAPEERKAKFAEAFVIARKMEPYIDASEE